MTSTVVIDTGVNLPGFLYSAQPFVMHRLFRSVLQFHHLQNGDINGIDLVGLLCRLNELTVVIHLE